MSDDKDFDFDLPDLPSDEELGITQDDYELLDESGEIRKDLPPPEAPDGARPPGAGKAAGSTGAGKEAPKPGKRRGWFGGRKKKKAKQAKKATSPSAAASTAGAPPPDPAPSTARGAASGDADAGGTPPEAAGDAAPGRSRYRGPLVAAALVGVAFASMADRTLPRPVPANAADTVFSSARAMTDLVEIARLPHPPGSPEHERVRAHLLDRMAQLGLEPTVQTSTALIRRDGWVRAATVRNLVGRLPGQQSTGAVLVTAHYDAAGQAVGAGDDATGVVTVLEAVRAARQAGPLRNDLIVLITDAEELGLLGARAFVDEHPWMDDVRVVLSVEMRGGGGPSIMFETGGESGWIVDAYRKAAPRPYTTSVSAEIYRRMPNDTDFTPFREAGRQGLNFAAVGRPHVYHQRYDAPPALSERTVQHHGLNVLSAIRALGQEDLAVVNAPDPVYFTLPGVGVVAYGERWVLPFGIVLVLLWVGVFLLGRRRDVRGRGVAAGLVAAGVVTGASAAAGHYGFRQLAPFHPEYGSLVGSSFHGEGWYLLALVATTMALVTLVLWVLRRWFSVAELTLGAVVLPLAGAVVASVVAPMAAMILQWPVLAALVAVAVLAILGRRRETGPLATVLAVVLAVPALVFLVPVVDLVWQAMNLSQAAILGGVMAVTAFLVLPALDVLRSPNGWWPPLVAVLLTGSFVGLGVLGARPDAERPAPSTLIYAMDGATGAALWATGPDTSTTNAGVAWATASVGGFSETSALEAYLGRPGDYRVRTAQPVAVGGVQARAVGDEVADGRRTVRVAVNSGVGAEMLLFQLPPTPELVAVNGVPLERAHTGSRTATVPVSILEHWGAPDTAVFLDFQVPPGAAAVQLNVVEHLLRPWELLGEEPFRRPPDLAPNVRTASDRALLRSSVRLELGGPVEMAEPGGAPGGGPVALPPGTPADSAGADTTAPPPDTTGTPPPDTTGAVPPAAEEAPPDTTAAPPAAEGTPPDTTGAVPPDTAASPSDTTGAASPDTAASPPDTTGTPPPTAEGTPPDTTGAVPPAADETLPGTTGPAPTATATEPARTDPAVGGAGPEGG